MVDTGAARGSKAGETQYLAYCKTIGKEPKVDPSHAACCHFAIGFSQSKGVARIFSPIGPHWLPFEVHIVNADIHILLSIDDVDRLGLSLNNLGDALIHSDSGFRDRIYRINGHPFVQWNPHTACFLTTVELRRLHRRFGHPSMEKLMKLERTHLPDIGPDTRRALANIERT